MEEEKPISAEEVVEALLEFLVEPFLPLKPQPVSLVQQESVAKQMHAVVLLYNHYHRNLQPEFEFLDFASFCKLVVVLKPALMACMKLMHLEKYSGVSDIKNQLSVTEKAIMDACDMSIALDAIKDVPGTNEWPISKVSVFLIDSKGKNCFLLHNSVTSRVWSVIEKDVDVSKTNSEGTRRGKVAQKRTRTSVGPLTDNQSTDIALQKLAMLAVKEVAGIDQTGVRVLESNVVRSLSQEKAASCFYVMQGSPSWDEYIQVPIKDAMTSLQGPLVKMSSCGWMVTPVVEYFHLLPYAEILLNCMSRGFGVVGSIHGVAILSTEERSNNGYQTTCFPNQVNGPGHTEVGISLVHGSQIRHKGQSFDNVAKIHCQPANVSFPETDTSASRVGVKNEVVENDSVKFYVTGCRDKNGDKIISISSSIQGGSQEEDCATSPTLSKPQYPEKLLDALKSKENALSQMGLRTLFTKREELFQQVCKVEKEIALCDNTIRTILDGGENSLVSKINSILEGCFDAYQKEATDPDRKHFHDQGSSQCLSEAVLPVQNPCQQLDEICQQNIWILPTYRVNLADGGFRSYVTVKGVDFELSCGGEIRPSPKESRMSASLNMIAYLQDFASQIK